MEESERQRAREGVEWGEGEEGRGEGVRGGDSLKERMLDVPLACICVGPPSFSKRFLYDVYSHANSHRQNITLFTATSYRLGENSVYTHNALPHAQVGASVKN